MPPTQDVAAAQTAVIGTEHVIDDVSAAGTYGYTVDTTNMALGDVLELRVYKILVTGGTRQVLYYQNFFDAQPADDVLKTFPPVGNALTDAGSLRFTLKQTDGTGRSYNCEVLKYA